MKRDVELHDERKAAFLEAFKGLRPDLYFPENWTQEQKDQVLEEIQPSRIKTGMLTAIPINCFGPKCIFARTCPLQQKGIAPVGKPCPYELSMVAQFMEEYMYELNVDPDNLIEVSMVRELVDQEVQYLRKTKVLANEHFIQENVVGTDSDGNPVFRKELHLAVELEDKLHRRKKDIRNQLLATREAKAKIGISAIDSTQALSDLMDEVKNMKYQEEKLLKQAAGTLYKDDYIVEAEVIEDGE